MVELFEPFVIEHTVERVDLGADPFGSVQVRRRVVSPLTRVSEHLGAGVDE